MTGRRSLPVIVALATAVPAAATMQLGVNTHFDQGWPVGLLDRAEAVHANGIRDTVSWGKVETKPGVYEFTPRNSGYADRACAAKMPLLLVIAPRNKLYDGGALISSPAGRRAFGAYAVALAARYPCLIGIEIGNEINALMQTSQAATSLLENYVPLVAEVRATLKARHPGVAIVGGSSLSVATGFIDKLADAGMLPAIDAVAIHPYADVPEQLPGQLDRLNAVMTRHGGAKPLWATEFGLYYPTPEAAPPHALKVMTLLSAAHVARAFWYALIDEPWYPNTGLFKGPVPKPAHDTFAMAATRLLGSGEARRIDAGDPLTYIYRFGAGPSVMWAGNRRIAFPPGTRVTDARGRPITTPAMLGPDPVIVETPGAYKLGPVPVLADTQLDFGHGPWHYEVVPAGGKGLPLGWIDWNWAPYVGRRGFDNVKVTAAAVTLGKPALVETYVSPTARSIRLSACLEPGKAVANVAVRIVQDGRVLWEGKAGGGQPPALDLKLGAGGAVAIVYANGGAAPALVRRRVRILAEPDASRALCPPVGAGRAVNP